MVPLPRRPPEWRIWMWACLRPRSTRRLFLHRSALWVLTIAASGSYASSRDVRTSWRPWTPPRRLTSSNAASIPSRMLIPSSCAGPLKAADWPKRILCAATPCSGDSASGWGVAGVVSGAAVALDPPSWGSIQQPERAQARLARLGQDLAPIRSVSGRPALRCHLSLRATRDKWFFPCSRL